MVDYYLEDGKMRCDKNFGTFPVRLMSSYGRFFTTTILHRPIFPLSSGTFPSDAKVERVG